MTTGLSRGKEALPAEGVRAGWESSHLGPLS